MGVDVELIRVEQQGTSPRRRRESRVALIGDVQFRLASALERVQHRGRTPMLDRIDPYGLLELTSVEMPQFLSELDFLAERAEGAGEEQILSEVRRVAETCRDSEALCLRFLGD
ncbi:hypothetical protein ACIBTZ_03530 [Micromonospora sp. NPDC049460]|uniref:hypothetical protein n=1 Tax=unclassified Micromonospora TaxID=2617518 RepID=UPI003716B7BA